MPKRPINNTQSTDERFSKYEALQPLLKAMFLQFNALSNKKPEGVLNKQKVGMVNRLLRDVLIILEDEPSKPYLDLLDEDDLPQNSDVLLVLSQFVAAMEAFRKRYWFRDVFGDEGWRAK